MPARTIHWYRCSRCALYQRLPRNMRETRLQLASVTKAEHAATPLSSATAPRLICRSTAMPISRPSAPLPTSPMNTRARGKLNGMNAATGAAREGGQREKHEQRLEREQAVDAVHEVVQVDRPDQAQPDHREEHDQCGH